MKRFDKLLLEVCDEPADSSAAGRVHGKNMCAGIHVGEELEDDERFRKLHGLWRRLVRVDLGAAVSDGRDL